MFALKNYQKRAIEILEQFLGRCRDTDSVVSAYAETLREQGMPDLPYRDQGFKNVPYVCLRIPTGGGKTVLASWAIDTVARHYLEVDYPVVLWLVPTKVIRTQTVEALQMPGHPYRAKLDESFQHRVRVLDIDEVDQIRPQDIGSRAIVVVSTLANLRVNDTSGRKVYAYREDFEPHFSKIPSDHPRLAFLEKVNEEDVQENGLRKSEIGKIKYSFANLLAFYAPMLIVDEAHNARTRLSFETLQRLRPKAIIEFTATPDADSATGSNVLFHVSVAELKAEEMIKLPVRLTEHDDWQSAVQDAVITREKLEKDARKDTGRIRPIVLFQAENKDRDVTVEVLERHLTDDLKVPAGEIAIATGGKRGLDGVDLLDARCEIRYIITNEALKEGWDCSFAYVFCSVKKVSSGTSAEQLLGRVLRMPYAKRRVIENLNRAYAHLATPQFSLAAQQLTDQLIQMGFEKLDIAEFIQPKLSEKQAGIFGEPGTSEISDASQTSIVISLPAMPDVAALSKAEQSQVLMTQEGNVALVKVTGKVSPNTEKAIIEKVKTNAAEKKKIQREIAIHNQRVDAAKAPSERGEKFGRLPQLCVVHQEEIVLAEPELFLDMAGWNLSDHPAKLENPELRKKLHSWELDADSRGEIGYSIADENSFDLNQGLVDVTEQDLVFWLDRKLRQPDVLQVQLIRFISDIVSDLLRQKNRKHTLTGLVRGKFLLARAIGALIDKYRAEAQREGYQRSLFTTPAVCLDDKFFQEFKPDKYPARPPYYDGRLRFSKHYFPTSRIEDLRDGSEEFECAKAIDSASEVKYWIRNLVRRGDASFWLPLARNKFYPDFVCELTDGRMLVVEYKGEIYRQIDDSREKQNVGKLWADQSGGKCLFLMAIKDDDGKDVRQQLSAVINA